MELPDSAPPFFFKRVWNPGRPSEHDTATIFSVSGREFEVQADVLPDEVPEGVAVFSLPGEGDLVIYGRRVISTYPEDAPVIAARAARGYIFSQCFSVVCPEGELGDHHSTTVQEITREEFEAARERGWS